jgi:TolA-binding protein
MALRQKREETAAQKLARAMKLLETDMARGYTALQRVATRYPRTPAAQQAAEQTQRIDSDPLLKQKLDDAIAAAEARALLTLLRSYLQADRLDAAQSCFDKLLDQYPTSPQAAEARTLLSNI